MEPVGPAGPAAGCGGYTRLRSRLASAARLRVLRSDRQVDRLGWRSVVSWTLAPRDSQIVMGIEPDVVNGVAQIA